MRHQPGNETINPTGVISTHNTVDLMVEAQAAAAPAPALANAPTASKEGTRGGFKFRSMFPELKSASFEDQDLMELGVLMMKRPDLGDHPTLTAGYTYLGQFIAHDISFIRQNEIPTGLLPPDQIPQSRNPSLALDSLYGKGPESKEHANLYEDDGASLKLGRTAGTGQGVTLRAYPNDLPRREEAGPLFRRAIIADERNDDNLVVAQTQVAFMKFHNAIVASLKEKGVSSNELFQQARRIVIQHYQWIILKDFLPKIIDESVLRGAIRTHPLKHFNFEPDQEIFIPAEFALAAFRFGHSLIRNLYHWNSVQKKAGLIRLFSLTGKNGNLEGTIALSSDWIIDWTRFYDFSAYGIARNQNFNMARAIQTSLPCRLKKLPRQFLSNINPEQYRSIAALDLIRGQRAGLPSGQDVASLLQVDDLKPQDIIEAPHEDLLKRFDQQTPLWYYILKEAEVGLKKGVNRLGAVGSHIIAETFVGLIRASEFSILPGDGGEPVWTPGAEKITTDQFGMAELLMFVRNSPLTQGYDELNPLG